MLPTVKFDYVVPDSPADLYISAVPAAPRTEHCGRNGVAELDRVWLAAARLESLQWEMDSARETLAAVLRRAAASGASLAALGAAAGMTRAELEAVLR